MGVALDGKRELTDDEIRARAAELGMIENTVLAPAPTKEGDADSQGQEEGAASDAEQPEEMPTTAPAPTVTAALTPTAAPTATAVPTATPTPTAIPTPMPTAKPTPTAVPTPTAKPTPTAVPTPTEVPTPTAKPTPTAVPTPTEVPTPTAKPTPTAAPTPTAKPTPTAIPTPTAKPTPTAVPTPTAAPTPTPDSGADNAQTVTITINGGEGSGTVSRKVAQAGLVESAADFDNYLCANGYDKHLAVGNHVIPVGATYEEIADILVSRPR